MRSQECAVRCLPSEIAEQARAELGAGEVRAVEFLCAISKRPEVALLVGDALADRLVAASPLIGASDEVRVLASLGRTSLCACDIATLVGIGQERVETIVRTLGVRGLVSPRSVAGMPFFALSAEGRELVRSIVARAEGDRG